MNKCLLAAFAYMMLCAFRATSFSGSSDCGVPEGVADKYIGLSADSVFMHAGHDTAVVVTRHGGWVIDSIRVYEDISGSRLLDRTFCFPDRDKQRMKRNIATATRRGWITVETGKRQIRLIAAGSWLLVRRRRAVLYLHKGKHVAVLYVEQEKTGFFVRGDD